MGVLARASFVLLVLAAGIVPANAQRYDGSAIFKFGVFGQNTRLQVQENQPLAASGSHESGYTGGVSSGIDFNITSRFLIGVEIDGSFGDARGVVNGTDYGFDYLFNLRGRVGAYLRPDLLVYATSGVSWLGFEAQQPGVGIKAADTVTGYIVGGGIEYDWGHAILFGEYSRGFYGSREFNLAAVRHEVDLDVDVIRVGLKFKIGHDHHQSAIVVDDPRPLK